VVLRTRENSESRKCASNAHEDQSLDDAQAAGQGIVVGGNQTMVMEKGRAGGAALLFYWSDMSDLSHA